MLYKLLRNEGVATSVNANKFVEPTTVFVAATDAVDDDDGKYDVTFIEI
jgi:hypothetical protein